MQALYECVDVRLFAHQFCERCGEAEVVVKIFKQIDSLLYDVFGVKA